MIKNFKYILIALVLISNLWGQSELHGFWNDNQYTSFDGSKPFAYGYLITGEKNQISQKLEVSKCGTTSGCEIRVYSTEKLIDAWMGDSYVENKVHNSVTGKKDKDYIYYTLVDDNTLLIGSRTYTRTFSESNNPKNIKEFEEIVLETISNSQSSNEVLEKSKNLINEKKYSKAILELNSLIKKYPNSVEAPEAQYLIADTYAYLRNYEVAISSYKLVVQKHSSSKSAINAQFMLGYIYANFLFDDNLARNEYKLFLDKYSNTADSNLIESVKFELEKLGKDENSSY